MIRDAARLLRYLHLQIHANSPKLQRRAVLVQAAHQPFNVRLTQSTCGRKPGGYPKKSNGSKIKLILTLHEKKRLKKKKLPVIKNDEDFFLEDSAIPTQKNKKVGRFDFHPELLGSF